MFKENVAKIWKDFCESTSLHGFGHLTNATSALQKLFWVIVILGMATLGIIAVIGNTGQFLNAGIVTTIQSSASSLKVSYLTNLHQYKNKGFKKVGLLAWSVN